MKNILLPCFLSDNDVPRGVSPLESVVAGGLVIELMIVTWVPVIESDSAAKMALWDKKKEV